jgi:hypothetical protein
MRENELHPRYYSTGRTVRTYMAGYVQYSTSHVRIQVRTYSSVCCGRSHPQTHEAKQLNDVGWVNESSS